MRFSEAVDAFLTAKETSTQATTLVWYRYQFEAIGQWLAAHGHDGSLVIAPELIDRFLAEQKRDGLKPATLNGRWRAFCALYNWLVMRRKLKADDNPMMMVERPAVPKREPRHAALDEFIKLLDSIPRTGWVALRDRLAVTTFFLTGLRVSELVNLRLSDYDVTGMRIKILSQKGGDSNQVPMLQAVCDAFIAYIYSRTEAHDDHVFVSCDGAGNVRGVLTRNGMYQRLTVLCRKAGIERINPHAFRHGLAMHLLNEVGAPTSLIQGILRHKSEATTKTFYARWEIGGVSHQFVEKMSAVDALVRERQGRK